MGIEADSQIEEVLTPREWLEDRRKIGMSQGLEVTYAMLSRLGMPQMAFPCVHVAGTNGKGTTCVYLANLDAKLRHDTRAELKRLQRDLNMTMVYATPDQLEALTMGDNITIIKDGKFIQKGTPDELYQNPKNLI